jgi:drug/metabolite transporter (DMT)-like permease
LRHCGCISSPVAGIATTAEPVLATALAWLFLGQALGASQLVGGALVVAGVLTAQLARGPAPEATPGRDRAVTIEQPGPSRCLYR